MSEVPALSERISWILACGCEPHVEHCGQCDGRRAAVREVERGEKEQDLVATLVAAGYDVRSRDGSRD